MTDHLTAATRRVLLRRAAALSLAAAGPDARAGTAAPDAADLALLAACQRFCALEWRKLALTEGPGRIGGDAELDRLLRPLMDEQLPALDALCGAGATTPAGLRAKALAFLLWDSGELCRRAGAQGFWDDRLLCSLLTDLAGKCWPPAAPA